MRALAACRTISAVSIAATFNAVVTAACNWDIGNAVGSVPLLL
jgi:hypothetical protein